MEMISKFFSTLQELYKAKIAKIKGSKKEKQNSDSTDEEEYDDHVESGNYKNGSHGTIYGIDRKVVRIIFIGIIVLFTVAYLYSHANNNNSDIKAQQINHKQELADGTSTTKGMDITDDYDALVKANQEKQNALQKNQGKTVNMNEHAERVNAMPQRSQTVIPQGRQQMMQQAPASYAQSYVLPSQAPQLRQNLQPPASIAGNNQASEKNEKESKLKSMEDKFKAAISFAFGNETAGNILSENENPADTSNQSGQVQSAYQQASYVPIADNTILAGTLIPVMLLTGINTDVEGQVMCQVQQDVYDYFGTRVLIPAGSRLIGAYEQKATNGRVNINFSTLQLADGSSWMLNNQLVAIDGAGYVGIKGKVDKHTESMISSGVFGSAIAALGSLASGNVSSSTNTYTAGQLASQGAMSNLINVTSKLFEKNANVSETVTVEPGYTFNVYVQSNIAF